MRRIISAKFPAKCYECGEEIKVGDIIVWDKTDKDSVSWHKECNRDDDKDKKTSV